MANGKIRVLIVDDSPLVRMILSQGLQQDPSIEVIGTAADPYAARDLIVEKKPHVMTLDVEMPRMDGVTFLRRLMPQYPLPVIMVSALTSRGQQITLEALEAGAVDFVAKPSSAARDLDSVLLELRTKVKIASTANVSRWKSRPKAGFASNSLMNQGSISELAEKIIVIGASTGGTEAVLEILSGLPAASSPGIVIVQHMPPSFTRMFAERLNNLLPLLVREAETGARLLPGHVLIAPGGKHLRVKRGNGFYVTECSSGEKVSGHCPSVDVLMHSVARHAGRNGAGVILTGMGRDGADGMLAMRAAGARTLAQDQATSVIFGMPREAFENGGAERLVPLEKIAEVLLAMLREPREV